MIYELLGPGYAALRRGAQSSTICLSSLAAKQSLRSLNPIALSAHHSLCPTQIFLPTPTHTPLAVGASILPYEHFV